MSDAVLLGKAALCLVSCVVVVVLLRTRPYERLSDRAFTRVAVATLAAARLSLFALLFVVLRLEPQSDVITYHFLATSILEGKVPYRDFFNGYAPFFPYLVSIPMRLWASPASIVLTSNLLEIAALPFWLAASRLLSDERTTRTAAVLYVFSPLLVCSVAVTGQNNAWLSLPLAASLYLLARERELASGLAFGAGIVLVKFLSLVHAPALFLAAPRRVRFTLGLAALPVLVYGAMYAMAITPLASLAYHSEDASSGNLPYLFTLFGIDVHVPVVNRAYNLGGVACLGALCLYALVRHRHRRLERGQIVHMIALLTFAFMLVSRKSFVGYFIFPFFAICLSVIAQGIEGRALAAFLAFGVVTALESSLWFRWASGHGLAVLFHPALPEGVARAKMGAFFFVEIALIGFYMYYLARSARALGWGARA